MKEIELNLHTPADGILQTHVTWADIEEDMQKVFDTSAVFGPNKSVKNIGEGNGFLSRMSLLEADWQGVSGGDLPARFVVKIATQLAMIELTTKMSDSHKEESKFDQAAMQSHMEVQAKKLHNTEVTVYTHLIKNGLDQQIPLPRIFYMRKFSDSNPVKGYIIMQFVDATVPMHIYKNIDREALRQPIRALAKMQAMCLDFTEDEIAEFTTTPFGDLFAPMFTDDALNSMIVMLRKFHDGALSDIMNAFEPKAKELLQLKRADTINDIIGFKRILCHGDLWSMNLMWRRVNKQYNLAAIIDFQTSHYGSPAADICRLINSTLSGEDRRNHWEDCIEEYFESFQEAAGEHEMPFTVEQLKQSYRLFYPVGGFMIVCMLGPMFDLLETGMSGDELIRTKDAVADKTRALIEDMLEFHERYGMIN